MGKSKASTSNTFKAALINGFTPVTVAYSPKVNHMLYIRKHEATGPAGDFPEGRTLFVVNVPPDATQKDFSRLFGSCGQVEGVVFGRPGVSPTEEQEEPVDAEMEDADDEEFDEEMDEDEKISALINPKGNSQAPKVTPLPTTHVRTLRHTGETAHLIFRELSAVQKAINLSTSTPLKWPKPDPTDPPLGLAHYIAKYKAARPPLDAVKEHADSSLEVYEYLQSHTADGKSRAGEETKGPIVDEDGFTLVQRDRRGRSTAGVGVMTRDFQMAIQQGEQNESAAKMKKHNEKIHKKDFYSFQVREKKRSAFIEQRRKFEQEKTNVEKLKAKRKFRRY